MGPGRALLLALLASAEFIGDVVDEQKGEKKKRELTPEEDKLYTTNGVSGDVTVIDVASLKAEKTIKVGRFPWGAAVLPKDKIPQ